MAGMPAWWVSIHIAVAHVTAQKTVKLLIKNQYNFVGMCAMAPPRSGNIGVLWADRQSAQMSEIRNVG